jgi:DNA uptake protein ComE-like DNA-binding protein
MNIFYVIKRGIKSFFTFTSQEIKGLFLLSFIVISLSIIKILLPYFYASERPYTDEELSVLSKPLLACLEPLPTSKSKKEFPVSNKDTLVVANEVRFNSPHLLVSNITKQNKIIEINQTDSATLTSIKGLGPYFASKIIKLRNKYHGLYSIWQLLEIYHMDSTKIQTISPFLTINENFIRKHDLNALSKDSIKGNYYFSFKMVDLINNYRKQHGRYKTIEEIQKIEAIPDSSYQKIKHYLEIRD